MESLEKKEQLNLLFDFYKSLLTDKQVLYFERYYREDFSLQEIAELYHVSRNAVYDHLKKVEDHLYDYENKLKLFESRENRIKLINQNQRNKKLKIRLIWYQKQ